MAFITARARGTIWKPVTCEHCSAQYTYLMEAEGAASDSTGLFHNVDIGELKTAATARLEHNLTDRVGAAYCPKCGRYQSYMIPIVRRQRVHKWYALPFATLVGGGVFAMAIGPYDVNDRSLTNVASENFLENFEWPVESGLIWFGVMAVLAAIAIKLCSLRIDPNQEADTRVGSTEGIKTREQYEELRVQQPSLQLVEWQ